MTGPVTAHGAALRPVRLAPWGLYTRYMLWNYVRHILIVTSALLSISLTTDVALWVWRTISANPHMAWSQLAYAIGRIVVLRATDLCALILPIACFLGVLWSEAQQTWTRERMTIWNTGRSPMQCITPVLVLAAGMALIQFSLDAHLRPAAVMTMEGRFPPPAADGKPVVAAQKTWIAAGDDLIHARIGSGLQPTLRDVTIYRLTPAKSLREILTADAADPVAGSEDWRLRTVRLWRITPPEGDGPPDDEFEQLDISWPLPPVWLTAYGIHPQYLPFRLLRELAHVENAPVSTARYQVWYQGRFARALFPGAMALLAATLSMLLLAYNLRFGAIFAIALAGYFAHIMIRIVTVFGENGFVNPFVAAWITPILLLLASCLVLAILQRKEAYRLAAG